MIAAAASWSITVARSRGRPSSFSAIAALARPGPIDAANSAPVSGAGKLRLLPSGRVTTTGIADECSFIPCAPSINAGQTGQTVAKKPRPEAGGVLRARALLADQRTRAPDTPPRGVVVVVVIRPLL